MCPDIFYPFYILIHSATYFVIDHFPETVKKKRKYNLICIHSPFPQLSVIHSLFCNYSTLSSLFCLRSLIPFFPSVTFWHIALFPHFWPSPFHVFLQSVYSLHSFSIFLSFSILFHIFSHKHFLIFSCSGVEILVLLERTFKKTLLSQYASAVVVIRGETASGRL